MNTRKTSTRLVVFVLALLLIGTTLAAVTQREPLSLTRVRICVKDNGQLRMMTGNDTSCDSSEQPMDWVVGGELTELRLGPGLDGSREDGIMQLAIAPSIIEGIGRRGGKVFAGFNDGPGQILFTLTGDLATIAELGVPAGDYVIFAKLTVEAEPLFAESSFQRPVFCKLTAGDDFDQARGVLEKIHTESPGNPDGTYAMGLTLQVAHRFSSAGRVVLSAAHGGTLTVTPQVQFRDLKIIAIEASEVSNVFLGAN